MSEINMGVKLPKICLDILWLACGEETRVTIDLNQLHEYIKAEKQMIANGYIDERGALTMKGAYAVAGYDPQDELQGR